MENDVRHRRTTPPGRERRLASVDRALTALRLFLREKGEWGVSELAGRLGVGKSAAHALLGTLAAHELVERDPATRRYRLGAAAFVLGAPANGHTALRDAVHPALARLADAAGATAMLCVPQDGRFRIVDAVEPPDAMRVALPVGGYLPLTCGCAGKAYLAHVDPATRARLLRPEDLRAYTPRAITKMPAYLAELRRARDRGYALDLEEYSPGVHAVGFPVGPPGGAPLGVVCVVGLAHRLPEGKLHAVGRRARALLAGPGGAPGARRPDHPVRASVGAPPRTPRASSRATSRIEGGRTHER